MEGASRLVESQISNAFIRTAVMMMIEIFRAGFCLMCEFFSDMQGVTRNEQITNTYCD